LRPRYGNMRDLVLGLEVVLPDGRIWNGLRALRKDNTGYDLKQMFIGAEGTLGVITGAVLKLFPRLTRSATAMVALGDVEAAIALLHRLQASVGNRIEAFEIMSKSQIDTVCRYGQGLKSPMPLNATWYALIEIADSDPDWDAATQLERFLERAAAAEQVIDAVVAPDLAKAERIWALRHSVSETNKHAGFTISNDTSVPISRVPQFIANVDARLGALAGATINHVGHIGDGNVHVVVVLSREVYTTPATCDAAAAEINLIVHEESVALDGSISAEHGIGQMHVDRLARFKPALDLELMRSMKALFDPLGLMNPGKIFARRASNSE
jgi:FAD/FMN-containing dehydrogenase